MSIDSHTYSAFSSHRSSRSDSPDVLDMAVADDVFVGFDVMLADAGVDVDVDVGEAEVIVGFGVDDARFASV